MSPCDFSPHKKALDLLQMCFVFVLCLQKKHKNRGKNQGKKLPYTKGSREYKKNAVTKGDYIYIYT